MYLFKLVPLRVEKGGNLVREPSPMGDDEGFAFFHTDRYPTAEEALAAGMKTLKTEFEVGILSKYLAVEVTSQKSGKKAKLRETVYRYTMVCPQCGKNYPGSGGFKPSEVTGTAKLDFVFDRARGRIVHAFIEDVDRVTCLCCGNDTAIENTMLGVDMSFYSELGTRYVSMRGDFRGEEHGTVSGVATLCESEGM